jgi:WXXGXW repeat (2 copies)
MKPANVLFGLAIALGSACTVSGTVHGMTVVYQEPPQAQVERVGSNPNHVWVTGHWDLNPSNGQWAWIRGHWERERPGSRWQEGRWERRGNAWYWIEGTWVGGVVGGRATVSSEYPTEGPPPPRTEDYGAPRPQEVWISGRWDWKSGTWEWVAGHWEAERPHEVWSPGRWEQQGGRWTWIDGAWGSGGVVGTDVGTTDDPSEEPPPPQAESYGTNKGHVWIAGRWEWKKGKWAWTAGRWEQERPKQVWHPGKWERRGNRWLWVEGRWQNR